jgi:hypothetical protein
MRKYAWALLLIPAICLGQVAGFKHAGVKADSIVPATPGAGITFKARAYIDSVLRLSGRDVDSALTALNNKPSAGGAGLQSVADTTALKALADTIGVVNLEALGTSGVGGGLFSGEVDSTYPEGVVAFGTSAGKQRVRLDYLASPYIVQSGWYGNSLKTTTFADSTKNDSLRIDISRTGITFNEPIATASTSNNAIVFQRGNDSKSQFSMGLDIANEKYPYFYFWRGAGFSDPPVTGDAMAFSARRSDGTLSTVFGSSVGVDTNFTASFGILTDRPYGLYISPNTATSHPGGVWTEIRNSGNGAAGSFGYYTRQLSSTRAFFPLSIGDSLQAVQWTLAYDWGGAGKSNLSLGYWPTLSRVVEFDSMLHTRFFNHVQTDSGVTSFGNITAPNLVSANTHGPELISDGGFDVGYPDWITNDWTISGSIAHIDAEESYKNLVQNIGTLSTGGVYELTFEISNCSVSAQMDVLGKNETGSNVEFGGSYPVYSNGSYSIIITGSAIHTIEFWAYTVGQSAFDLDNVSLKQRGTGADNDILKYDFSLGNWTNTKSVDSLYFRSVYSDSYYGDGSHLTGITAGVDSVARDSIAAHSVWIDSLLARSIATNLANNYASGTGNVTYFEDDTLRNATLEWPLVLADGHLTADTSSGLATKHDLLAVTNGVTVAESDGSPVVTSAKKIKIDQSNGLKVTASGDTASISIPNTSTMTLLGLNAGSGMYGGNVLLTPGPTDGSITGKDMVLGDENYLGAIDFTRPSCGMIQIFPQSGYTNDYEYAIPAHDEWFNNNPKDTLFLRSEFQHWVGDSVAAYLAAHPPDTSRHLMKSTILLQNGTGTDSVFINTSYRIPLFYSTGVVIDTLVYVGMGSTARNVQCKIAYGTDQSAAGTLVDTTTVTSNNSLTKQTGAQINSAIIPAGNFAWLEFSSVTTAFKTIVVYGLGHKQ